MPIGRQCASGLSLLLSAMRLFTSFAAEGLNGRPSLNPEPLSRNDAEAISSRDTFGGGGVAGRAALAVPPPPRKLFRVWSAGGRTICQIPERSGLPSDVRGAGASRLGCPSGNLGTLGVGRDGHCARALVANRAIPKAAVMSPFITSSRYWCVIY